MRSSLWACFYLSSVSVILFGCGFRGYQQVKCEQGDRRQCGKEDILIRYKGFRSVIVHDFFRVRKNQHADIRADHAGNEDLRENTHALELSRFADGCQIAYFCSENRHSGKISAHHQKRADENGDCGTEGKEHDISNREPSEADGDREGEALAVIYLAPKHRDDGGKHDGGRHDEDVIGHAEGYLVVKNQVGHEDLYGNIEDDESKKMEVQVGILFDR